MGVLKAPSARDAIDHGTLLLAEPALPKRRADRPSDPIHLIIGRRHSNEAEHGGEADVGQQAREDGVSRDGDVDEGLVGRHLRGEDVRGWRGEDKGGEG